MENENVRQVSCECGKVFCYKCMKDYHIDDDCDQNERLEILKGLNLDGNLYKPCPYCLNPAAKIDNNCDHVKCPSCKKDWNFCCSSRRNPCLSHGLHYHRKECEHYKKNDDGKPVFFKDIKDEVHKDCEECKAFGKVCPRPGPLVDGDISKEERAIFKIKVKQ